MIPTNLPAGTKIVCINDSPNHCGEKTNVVKGEVYTVRGYQQNADEIGVLLFEIDPPDPPYPTEYIIRGYYCYRFRLLEDLSIFENMLDEINNMTPEEIEELQWQLEIEQNREEMEKIIE
jgi:hypothetical protein